MVRGPDCLIRDCGRYDLDRGRAALIQWVPEVRFSNERDRNGDGWPKASQQEAPTLSDWEMLLILAQRDLRWPVSVKPSR